LSSPHPGTERCATIAIRSPSVGLDAAMHFPRFAAGEFREPAKDRFEFGNRTGWTKGNGAPAAQRNFHFDSNVSVEQRD
jgi:hypothetical protein